MMWSTSVIVLVIASVIIPSESGGITVEQMKKTGTMMRAACMPKFKVSEEVANGLAQKVFPDDKVVKCYVNCIMEMMQSMKKGKINYETTLKQIDLMLPEELKPGTKEAVLKCKNAADGIKDNCEAAYALLQCMAANHADFFFP